MGRSNRERTTAQDAAYRRDNYEGLTLRFGLAVILLQLAIVVATGAETVRPHRVRLLRVTQGLMAGALLLMVGSVLL